MRKNGHQMFFSEVKKITFWNQISSSLWGEKTLTIFEQKSDFNVSKLSMLWGDFYFWILIPSRLVQVEKKWTPNIFLRRQSEVKKIIFWNRISSRLGGGGEKTVKAVRWFVFLNFNPKYSFFFELLKNNKGFHSQKLFRIKKIYHTYTLKRKVRNTEWAYLCMGGPGNPPYRQRGGWVS